MNSSWKLNIRIQLKNNWKKVQGFIFRSQFHKNILSINYLNEYSRVNFYSVDDNFDKIFKINIKKGHWFSKADLVERIKPVIISESTEEDLFNGSNSLGNVIKNNLIDKAYNFSPDIAFRGVGIFINGNPACNVSDNVINDMSESASVPGGFWAGIAITASPNTTISNNKIFYYI